MKLVILVSCLVSMVMASDVIELTDADFNDKIGTYDTALVEFFAPWCGHCKKLTPEFEKAATALKKSESPVSLVKVDCIANPDACGKFGVSGYPTLKIFRGGEVSSDYQGPRVADGIVSFMKKQVEPASNELNTVAEFEAFTGKSGPVLIGFFPSAEDTDAKVFSKLTGSLREDYSFGHSYSSDVSEKAGFSGAVVLFRPKHLHSKFEDKTVTMTEAVSEENVKSFMKDNVNGLCGHMTTDNQDKFSTKPLLTAYYKVDYEKDVSNSNYWRNSILKVGKGYKDDLSFSVADASAFSQALTDAGLTHDKFPIVMVKDASDKKYVMELDDKVTDRKTFMVALEAFIKSYLAGDVLPKIKSEAVPEQVGATKVVVGQTFEDIVMDENKDVLIEFYAPWCGHCKTLQPKWDELAEKMKENEDLVIAKIDATANDSPSQFAVSGFPTIYWAPKDNKKNPSKYNGGREVADFVTFLEKNRDSELKKTEL